MTFPAYPTYRDSGVEWLGAVPEHWVVKQLRYLGRFRKGLTITKADLADTGIPCLNYGEVHSLYPFEVNQDIQPLKSVPPEYLEKDPSACIKHGDFVFADTSEDLDGVGNFTHVSGMEPLFAGYHTIIYSLDSEISSRFLAYCLDSFAFRTQLRLGVKGVKVFSVTQEILRGGTAWLPSTVEQTQIARFLDHETARIDALIEEQQRLIELLKEKRQAVISHAVTKGFDPTVPMKDSGVEWLGEVPAHWEVTKLGWILNELTYGFTNPMPTEDDGPAMLTANDIGWGTVLYEQARSTSEVAFREMLTDKSRPKAGDLLLTKDGTLGRVAVHDGRPACINQSVALIRPDTRIMSSEFLCSLLQASCYQTKMIFDAGGTTIKHIYITILAKMNLAVPSLDEQQALLNFISSETCKFDRLTSEAEQVVNLLQERRSALISAAVTGKIDVRGWQPPVSIQAPKFEVAEAD